MADTTQPAKSKSSWLREMLNELNPAKLQARAERAEQAGNRWRAFGFQQLAIFVHTAKGLRDEEITRRAAALTYHTLLSIVPVLAVAFALFKAFGGLQKLEGPLRDLIVENLAAGRGPEVGQWIDKFINNINAGAIAGVGVIFLFYSAIGLLSNIEQAFNKIWGIDRGRPLHMRFAIYWCMLTLAPPLVGLSLSLSGRLQSSAFAEAVRTWLPFGLGRVLISASSVLSVCVVFIFIYQLVPNTKVRFRCALLGGLVAGALWNASKVLFLWLTAGSVKYSAIYGALGALPLIMLWIYLSWIIVLFGVTFTMANQTLSTTSLSDAQARMSQDAKELVGLRLMAVAARRFLEGDPAPTAEELATGTGAPMASSQRLLDQLVAAELLSEVGHGGDPRYGPARALESISAHDVLVTLRSSDGSPELSDEPALLAVADALSQGQKDSIERLSELSLAQLAEQISAAERADVERRRLEAEAAEQAPATPVESAQGVEIAADSSSDGPDKAEA
jgi:membrane protein